MVIPRHGKDNDTVSKQFSQTISNCNCMTCQHCILHPPDISDHFTPLHLIRLLGFWYHVVVQLFQIIQSIRVSIKEECQIIWPLPQSSIQTVSLFLLQLASKLNADGLSCKSMLSSVVGINLAVQGETSLISDNK